MSIFLRTPSVNGYTPSEDSITTVRQELSRHMEAVRVSEGTQMEERLNLIAAFTHYLHEYKENVFSLRKTNRDRTAVSFITTLSREYRDGISAQLCRPITPFVEILGLDVGTPVNRVNLTDEDVVYLKALLDADVANFVHDLVNRRSFIDVMLIIRALFDLRG